MAHSHFNKNSLLVQIVPFSIVTIVLRVQYPKKTHACQWKKRYVFVNLRDSIPLFPSININNKDLEETANKN